MTKPVTIPDYDKQDVQNKLDELEASRKQYIKNWMFTKYPIIALIVLAILVIINVFFFYSDNTAMNIAITAAHTFFSLCIPFVWIESEALVKNKLYDAECELRLKLGLETINEDSHEEFRELMKLKENTIYFSN